MPQTPDTTPDAEPPERAPNGLLGPVLTGGFGTAVLMWVAWYLAHVPGLVLAPSRVAILMMLALVIGTSAAGYLAGPRRAGLVGLGAGVVAALLDVLVLLSNLVGQPSQGEAGGVTPDAILYVPAFAVAAGLTGAVCAILASKLLPKRSLRDLPAGHDPWLERFAVLASIAFVPLVLIGGGVTSTESGMSVSGWPNSDGYLMFLYPIERMSQPRVYFEHGHRLFGAFAGLTTLTLMLYVLAREPRRYVRILAIVLFGAVVVQGVMGGLRVAQNSPYLGVLHGVLAQLVVGTAVALAVVLSASFKRGSPTDDPLARRLRVVATGLTHSLILQIVLGALYRHMSAIDPEPAGAMHVLYTHVGFSIVVVIFALLAGFKMRLAVQRELAPGAVLGRAGNTMLASVVLQFVLGWAAFFVVLGADPRGAPPGPDQLADADPVPIAEALVTTAHQANGALLVAMTAMAFVWARRLRPRRRA